MLPVSVIPDEDAVVLSSLIDHFYADVFAYLYQLVGDRDLALSLAHQTFLPARSERQRLVHSTDPAIWLFQAATALACAQSADCRPRRRLRRKHRHDVVDHLAEAGHWGHPSLLQASLATLPFQQRAALLLFGQYGLSLGQTASALSIRPAETHRLLSTGFGAIGAIYQTHDQAHPDQAGLAQPAVPLPAGNRTPQGGGPAIASLEHERTQSLLPFFVHLSAEDQAYVAGHLAQCDDCTAQRAVYDRIHGELAAWPRAWSSRHAMDRLQAAARTPREESKPLARSPRFIPGAAVLALVAVFIVAGAWYGVQVHLSPGVTAAGRPALAARTAPATPTTGPSATETPGAQAAAPAILPAGMQAADADWLRRTAIPLNTTEPGNSSPADLAPLKAIAGNARIVALADSSPGALELYGLKQRILEYLVDQMNFNTLAVDSSWPQAELMNDYLQSGQGDPERLALMLTGSYRQSPDLLKTIDWLRAHNQDPLGIPKVAFHGFDILQTYSHVPLDMLVPYLKMVDPEGVALTQGDAQDLYRHIIANRSSYLQQSTYMEFNEALRNARSLAQYDAFAVAGDPAARSLLREQFMAENVFSMLRGFGGGNRLILWGPASDLGVNNESGNLGAILRQRFGQNYVVINLDFYQGSVSAETARTGGTRGPTEVHRVEAAPAGSYEDYLHLAGKPLFLLDLRPARTTPEEQGLPSAGLNGRLQPYLYRGGAGGYPGGISPYSGSGPYGTPAPSPAPTRPLTGTVWLQGPHLARQIQGSYDDCAQDTQFTSLRFAESFDAVIYVDAVTPAPVLFQLTGPAHPVCPPRAAPAP